MIAQDAVIKTASPIRAWYLTTFRGLKVRAVRITPVLTIMGLMYYSRYWVLVSSSAVPHTFGHL